MVVNSIGFLLFFIIVFLVYYLPAVNKSAGRQNIWILVVSYVFYGIADWRMLPILLGATVIFYRLGLLVKKEVNKGKPRKASRLTTFRVILGVSILLYFKYLNFFADSFAHLLNAIGFNVSWTTINVVLPVGVSFFTFKLISYIIEIHREHINPCSNFVEFGSYISFFPTILAGPIDRPNRFLPQLGGVRKFDYEISVDGCRQILWGMFTKMCIADNLSNVTTSVWANYDNLPASSLLIAALLYPLEIYADFDGYSNMAIGIAKLLGLKVTRNFNHPLLGRNPAEYWRRWHMSLTSWITDYVFMPLNIKFMEYQKIGVAMAVIINLVVIGLWHGANWTYGLFGLYHGLLFIPLIFSGSFGKNRKIKNTCYGFPLTSDVLKMLGTYCLVAIGHVIFVAPNVFGAFHYFENMFAPSLLQVPVGLGITPAVLVFCLIMIFVEWVMRNKEYSLQLSDNGLIGNKCVRYSIYYLLIILIYVFQGESSQFIYFQF